MTVKEIFDLRKQGKIEEAYEAIRPVYREQKGKYTTLCMFWTASDVFKLRLGQGRVEDAEKKFRALERLVPSIEDDKEGKAKGFMHYAESRLIKASDRFRKHHFAMRDKNRDIPIANSVLSGSPVETVSPAATVPAASPAAPPAPSGSPTEPLNKGQQAVLDCIKAHEGINVPHISGATNIPSKSIERHISAFIDKKLVEHWGSKKIGGYYPL